ncbi:MAG: hypothetical protein GY847_23080 [Proteobacteria bacterium]|nr:hypothetical protein [Pseudomonadota bacterium]
MEPRVHSPFQNILASEPMTAEDTVDKQELRYAGAITEAWQTEFPKIAAIAEVDDMLTSMDVK